MDIKALSASINLALKKLYPRPNFMSALKSAKRELNKKYPAMLLVCFARVSLRT